MKCRYCNIALAPLRSLTDGEFCCDDHRHAFNEEQAARNDGSWQPPPLGALLPLPAALHEYIPAPVLAPLGRLETREFRALVVPPAIRLRWRASTVDWAPPLCDRMLPLEFSAAPENSGHNPKLELPAGLEFPCQAFLPQLSLDPISTPFETEPARQPEAFHEQQEPLSFETELHPDEESRWQRSPYRQIANSWHWACDAWTNVPNDLKIVAVILPVLLALGLGPAVSKLRHRAPARPPVAAKLPSLSTGSLSTAKIQLAVSNQWNNLHQTILNRAAVEFTDDFRSGLDAWDSRANLTTSWSYDASGFVQPGPLAVFKPTEDMTDYRFQFLGEIDQKALGCAFRASNLNNYYAVKFVVVKPGPLPLVRMVRYAVVNGKEGRRVEKPLPVTVRPDTLYRIVVDVRGSDFTIMAQGQVVDFWSDNSLPRGGVGFFCNRGEKARVRWVEVSHQYDALGRLCAYLAPYGFEGGKGTFN